MLVAAFGDSITAGVHLQEEQTYLYMLGKRFDYAIRKAGFPGQTTRDALRLLEAEVLAFRPDVCILQFGMNDHVALSETDAKVPLPEFKTNLAHMAEQLQRIGTTLVLCTIHPIIEGDGRSYYYSRHPQQWYAPSGVSDRIRNYNAAIRDVAAGRGCMLADIEADWERWLAQGNDLGQLLRTIENSGSNDGVHPTRLGHERYAACIAARLGGAL
ncbi:hypothetical protein FE783_27690 [Paenibacillus mesophilus]|uniref:SGNH/GDSL hydrolase family protein n=1 Tax=Paenibacillus mesophilus TaxID=2582849 RepID=UPI00110E13C0|nr:SGNH/GDSL hydrolase family protein [Paenibacillus mesophilus]TMV45926.1 hypothetical protein FE783_27690 [Paenibacillus mesophilus]